MLNCFEHVPALENSLQGVMFCFLGCVESCKIVLSMSRLKRTDLKGLGFVFLGGLSLVKLLLASPGFREQSSRG